MTPPCTPQLNDWPLPLVALLYILKVSPWPLIEKTSPPISRQALDQKPTLGVANCCPSKLTYHLHLWPAPSGRKYAGSTVNNPPAGAARGLSLPPPANTR